MIGRTCESSQVGLPPKSSQLSTLSPTELDKIEKLRVEVQAGAVIGVPALAGPVFHPSYL